MLRCGQMILAQALLCWRLGRGERGAFPPPSHTHAQHTHTHTRMHTHTHTHAQSETHTRIQPRRHTDTHTHVCTHTLICYLALNNYIIPDTHVSSCSTLSQPEPDESWHCCPGIYPSHQGRKKYIDGITWSFSTFRNSVDLLCLELTS